MSGPETRMQAFHRIGPVSGEYRARVLAFIRSRGSAGATDRETEAALNIIAQTVTPRRGELVTDGLVADSRMRRPTPSGRMAVVWVAVELSPKTSTNGGLFDE